MYGPVDGLPMAQLLSGSVSLAPEYGFNFDQASCTIWALRKSIAAVEEELAAIKTRYREFRRDADNRERNLTQELDQANQRLETYRQKFSYHFNSLTEANEAKQEKIEALTKANLELKSKLSLLMPSTPKRTESMSPRADSELEEAEMSE